MDFAVALALISLFAATLLSNVLARRRESIFNKSDPVAEQARELLLRERAAPVPQCPTLSPEHWSCLEAAQPLWRRKAFHLARERYFEARAAFSRNSIDGELFYPEPGLVVDAAHQLLMLTERY